MSKEQPSIIYFSNNTVIDNTWITSIKDFTEYNAVSNGIYFTYKSSKYFVPYSNICVLKY